MKQRFPLKHAALVSAVAAALTMPAFADSRSGAAMPQMSSAQGMTSATHGTTGSAARQLRDDVRASRVLGMEVRDRRGEKLGKLKDVVVDLNENRVHYAVVQPEGSEGLLALPARVFESGNASSHLVIDAQRSNFEHASGFGERWPGMDDARYWSNVHRQLGDHMALQPGKQKALRRASELLKTDIVGRAGDGIGVIRDVVVNFSNGTVHYVVADFDSPRFPDALVALPLGALEPSYGRDALMLNLSAEQVAAAPSFSEDRWPDLADASFRERVARTLTNTTAQMGATASITGMESPTPSSRQRDGSALTGVQGRSPLQDPGVTRPESTTSTQASDQARQEPQPLGRGIAPPDAQTASQTDRQIPQPLGLDQPLQTSDDAMKQAQTPATAAPLIDARPFNEESFKRLDRDGDGRISSEEARMDPTFMAAWHELDRGNTGFVTLDDVRTYREQKGLR